MAVIRIPVTDRETWLAHRRQDLTASDIAAVAGVDSRRSPLRIYAEKTGAILPDDENDVMRRGRWLEAAVVEALRDTYPAWDIRRAGVYLRDPEIRMGATPDVVAEDPGQPGLINVQCKVVARPVFEREWDDDRAPLKFELQTLAEGMLLDADRNLVAALVVDTYSADLEVREVPRHAGAEARIRAIVEEFWSNVAAGVRPEPDYTQDADVIAAMHPQSYPGQVANLAGDNHLSELLAERVDLKTRAKADERRIAEIDAEVKAKLADAELGELPGWRITWKTQSRAGHVVQPSTFRVLRITDRREKEGLL